VGLGSTALGFAGGREIANLTLLRVIGVIEYTDVINNLCGTYHMTVARAALIKSQV
jgi:hypothetical protein